MVNQFHIVYYITIVNNEDYFKRFLSSAYVSEL